MAVTTTKLVDLVLDRCSRLGLEGITELDELLRYPVGQPALLKLFGPSPEQWDGRRLRQYRVEITYEDTVLSQLVVTALTPAVPDAATDHILLIETYAADEE